MGGTPSRSADTAGNFEKSGKCGGCVGVIPGAGSSGNLKPRSVDAKCGNSIEASWDGYVTGVYLSSLASALVSLSVSSSIFRSILAMRLLTWWQHSHWQDWVPPSLLAVVSSGSSRELSNLAYSERIVTCFGLLRDDGSLLERVYQVGACALFDELILRVRYGDELPLSGEVLRGEDGWPMGREILHVLDLLLIVEDRPACNAEHVAVGLVLDCVQPLKEGIPFWAIFTNHFNINKAYQKYALVPFRVA